MEKGLYISLVGVRGLEPPASTSRTWRASQLRYTPKIIVKSFYNKANNYPAAKNNESFTLKILHPAFF